MFDPAVVDCAVDLLVELAGGGRALELGIGTGRIALPLARRGVPPYGIDLSKAMVARLHAKPGGENVDVAIGDFATTTVDGTFSLAYLVFNTILILTTQAAWPSELDLMAQLGGLRLRKRWAGWNREPFTSESGKHVSVWEKPTV